MRTRAQTARLGVFIAVAFALMLATLIILSGRAFLQARDHYHILFSETVSGLEVGAAVKLLGVRVGRIEAFRVRSDGIDKVEVDISLDHGTPIRTNARAILSGSGITGLMFVEITGGTADADLVKPGGEIPAGSSLLGSLTGKAENIALKTDEVLNRVLTIADEQNINNLKQSLENVETATLKLKNMLEGLEGSVPAFAKASERLNPLMTQLGDAAVAVRDAAGVVNGVAGETRKVAVNLDTLTRSDGVVQAAVDQLRQTLQTANTIMGGEHADQTAKDVQAALHSFTDTMNQLTGVLSASGADVRRISNSLRSAAENLEEFARAIRENPSLLIRPTEQGE
ncbi:MAG TPA: MlaD family protein [Candidatus Kryptonia bacterium]|nr:MlaD family protein [Candidatus Kryptonia bacterium]